MAKQYKTTSRSAMARELLTAGKLSVKAIAKRTGLTEQTIYTIRWKMAKNQGLGAIKPQTLPVGKGTGIAASVPRAAVPLEFEIIDRKPKKKSNARRNAQLARRARERQEQAELTEQAMRSIKRKREENTKKYWNTMIGAGSTALIAHMIKNQAQPVAERTLWQRIKGFFVGA